MTPAPPTSELAAFIEARLSEQRDECGGTGEYRECWDLSEFAEASIAAIRAVVALHTDTYGGYGESCAVCMHPEDDLAAGAPYPCPTLRHVAAIWADNEAFDPAWSA